MDLIKSIEDEFLKEDLPSFGSGDTVKVNVKVKALQAPTLTTSTRSSSSSSR